jgi:uncharacterized protein YqfB (UPF0267 family)
MAMKSNITFYKRFVGDILSGKKSITIRNELDKNYLPSSLVQASTYEGNEWFASLIIQSVESIEFEQINEFHATQENMTLKQLKEVIDEIYPGVQQLYVISFKLKN